MSDKIFLLPNTEYIAYEIYKHAMMAKPFYDACERTA